MNITKQNRRVVLLDGQEVKYTPPDFLKDFIYSRSEMSEFLINSDEPLIDRIRNFERVVWDRYLKKKYPVMFQ